PVFFVEIKDPRNLGMASARDEADKQVRGRYDVFLKGCEIPFLHGISAFGHMVRFYKGVQSTGKISPPRVAVSKIYELNNDYLQDGWGLDILSDAGREKMTTVAHEIGEMCAAL
ncbi:hypothetical protein C8Q76DRAFT_587287, partial [Earliella scabrosa]